MIRTHLFPSLLLLLTLSWPALAESLTEEVRETHPLSADGAISLENINGDVTIASWERNEVEIKAIKRGKTQESLDSTAVKIHAQPDRIEIETEYTKKSSGWLSGLTSHASVDYTLQVPKNARLTGIELVNGSLRVSGVAGRIEADLVNGSIQASDLGGDAELQTVNGRIEVSFASLERAQSIQLSSVNGAVEVCLPTEANAAVEASTVHGQIDSEFSSLEVDRGQYVGSSLAGRLGRGTAKIELDNVNGSIRVCKRP